MSELASLIAEASGRLQAWSRLETDATAARLAEGTLDADTGAASDQLYALLAAARSTVGAFSAALTTPDNASQQIRAAWGAVSHAFDAAESLPKLLAALEGFLQALAGSADGDPQTEAGLETYESGTLPLADLRSALGAAIAETDWEEAERLVGQSIPDAVRAAPLDVSTLRDGFTGATALQLRYAPWASGSLRAGLQHLMARRWLPALRSQQGEGALGAVVAETDDSNETLCTIHFGTNRALRDGRFTSVCAEGTDALQFGVAEVSVPVRRRRGDIPRPWQVLGRGPQAVRGRHVILTDGPRIIGHDAFVETLRLGVGPGAAFLFVHGYNTPFEAGFWRTAQLAVDLEVDGPVLHYAWPSAGNPVAYGYDGENIKASREPFKAFVRTLLEEATIPHLNIVVHSKGGELVLEAMAELAREDPSRPRAQHLVLASPDVDRVVAEGLLRGVPALFSSVTLYANAHDRPLALSRGLALRERIGGALADSFPFIAPQMDTIDAADTDFDWFGLNHDAYVEAPVLMYDLAALLKRGIRPPDQRSPVIRPRDCPRGRYYQVVTT